MLIDRQAQVRAECQLSTIVILPVIVAGHTPRLRCDAIGRGSFGKTAVSVFSEVSTTDLVTQIARQITEAIVTGHLKPGERLTELQLSREFGTSRAPVREAARLLESQGLVTFSPRRGFFVPLAVTGCLEPNRSVCYVCRALCCCCRRCRRNVSVMTARAGIT